MALIQKFGNSLKKKLNFLSIAGLNKLKTSNLNPFFLLILISLFTVTFYVISNFIKQDNLKKAKNFEVVTSSNEFSNFTNFFLSKINSPYKEIKYSIKNNDSIEKILKKYNVIESDINDISSKLKRKKLKNIYTGRELSLIIKN